MACTGHTSSQGAFSQCMHGTGWIVDVSGLSSRPCSSVSMRSQCMSRRIATCSLPTTAMLFSDWQATTQALQPTHAV